MSKAVDLIRAGLEESGDNAAALAACGTYDDK
jgi:hypothetical protein